MNIRYDRIIAWLVLLFVIVISCVFAINSDIKNTSNDLPVTPLEESNISTPETPIEESSEISIEQDDNSEEIIEEIESSEPNIEEDNSIIPPQEDSSSDVIVSNPPEELEDEIRGPQGMGDNIIIILPPVKPAITFTYYTHYIHPNAKKYPNPIKINLSYEQQVIAYNLCLKYEVPYELMLGLWEKESCLNINIGSKQNKYSGRWYYGIGMVDIKYCSLNLKQQYGVNLCTPYGGLEGSIIIVKEKLNTYQNDWHKALMAYNQGNHSAERAWKKGNLTSSYSEHVIFIANNLIPEQNNG